MKLNQQTMPTNGEAIRTKFDLLDTVGYCLVETTLNEISYQTPFGLHYDFYTSTTKNEIKVRNKAYNEPEIEYTKVAEMLLQRYEDERNNIKNKYLFRYVVVPENKVYTVDLDTVLKHKYETVNWPKTTVGDKKKKTKLVYKVPLNEWESSYCDCTMYDKWIEKGMKKYNIK